MSQPSADEIARAAANTAVGRPNFIAGTALDTPERSVAIEQIVALIAEHQLDTVRVGFVDTHGQVRIHPIAARHFAQAARNGVAFTTALLAMDSANIIFQNVFSADGGFGIEHMGGAGDMLAMPDPATFRVLPWARKTGWVLSDLYLSKGERCPLDPRWMMQKACGALDALGLKFVGGVEIECHVLKIADAQTELAHCTQPPNPPQVTALRHGFQYMNDQVVDALEPLLEPLREALVGMGLPVRTLEAEWGPGQIEITLDPLVGVEAADVVIMLRTAVKQVARRLGLVASFMAKPNLPNVFSSGWHLHQSVVHSASGANAFTSDSDSVSEMGRHFIGGMLRHVRAGTAFSNPTINGYKRLNANPLSPKRAVWSIDNKGAMCRLVGGPGDPATRIENRTGEPAANPYLYMASQIFAGIDGIQNRCDPGPPLDDPYTHTQMELMPGSLMEAIEALTHSELYHQKMGDAFVRHFVGMKRHEIGRFLSYVTDWEQLEYFEMY